jgi:hypothetical protein
MPPVRQASTHQYVQCKTPALTKPPNDDLRKSNSVYLHNETMRDMEKEISEMLIYEKPSVYNDLSMITFQDRRLQARLTTYLNQANIQNKTSGIMVTNEMDDLIDAFKSLHSKCVSIMSDRKRNAASKKEYLIDINLKAREHGLKPVKTITEAKILNEEYGWGIERKDYGTAYGRIERTSQFRISNVLLDN